MVISIIKDKLSKTRQFLHEHLERLTSKGSLDKSLIAELEGILVQADLGLEISDIIIKEAEKRACRGGLEKEEIYSITRNILLDLLKKETPQTALNKNPNGPTVILILGVNGTGKTTTIAKLAYRFKQEGKKVLLAAGDTFRAAAIEQLEVWAERVGVEVVKHVYKADPSAVSFDALKAAANRRMDYLIIDTAGRFHTKIELVDELKKIDRTLNKNCPGAPHEKLLIIDATTGQNGLAQAKQFHTELGLTGIIATKLDGTAKGGIIVNIQRELGIPIKFIGIGQELTDLLEFDPLEYANSII